MNEPMCNYADCGQPLEEIIPNLCVCQNDHVYHVRTRGQGDIFEYYPASWPEDRMAIEIRDLRRKLAANGTAEIQEREVGEWRTVDQKEVKP